MKSNCIEVATKNSLIFNKWTIVYLNVSIARHLIAEYVHVFVDLAANIDNRRIHTQRLLENAIAIFQSECVLVADFGTIAKHLVYLGARLFHKLFVLCELKKTERERVGGRLLTSDEEGHEVVDH